MIDVIDFAAPVAQVDQDLDDGNDVLVRQRARTGQLIAADAAVEFHPAHCGQVVTLLGVKQAVEQRANSIFGRGLARTHHAIDRHLRSQLVGGFVGAQRLRDVGALIQIVGIDGLDRIHAAFDDLLQQIFRHLIVGIGDDLPCLLVDQAVPQCASDQEIVRYRNLA